MSHPFLVAVAGGTCSGKSSFIKRLQKNFDEHQMTSLFQDDYYKDLSHLTPQGRQLVNFDHPDAIDTDLLFSHIDALCKGKSIQKPNYDFVTHTRNKEYTTFTPTPLILLDGIFSLHYKKITELAQLKIFIDADEDLRLIRRINRDQIERGRSLQEIINQYLSSVKPMHEKYVSSSKDLADIIIPSVKSLDTSVNIVTAYLKLHLNT
jgi:uridine kinase